MLRVFKRGGEGGQEGRWGVEGVQEGRRGC